MIDARFTPEMRELLRSMRGKVFRSYEFADEGGGAYGNLRVNLGRSAVELTCLNQDVTWSGEPDEVAVLTCSAVDRRVPFVPFLPGTVVREYLVGERVESVEVVTDRVALRGDEYPPEDIAMDMALAVTVDTGEVYTFSRNEWFDESIEVRVGDSIDVPYTPERARECYENEGSYVVDVTRTVEAL